MSERNIFKSVPAAGAIEIDATGPDDMIILDIENGLGEKFHFEHKNKDCPFVPPSSARLIKPPSGIGKESFEAMKKHLIVFRVK